MTLILSPRNRTILFEANHNLFFTRTPYFISRPNFHIQTVPGWLADEARRNPLGHSGGYAAAGGNGGAGESSKNFGGKDFRTGPNYNGGHSDDEWE